MSQKHHFVRNLCLYLQSGMLSSSDSRTSLVGGGLNLSMSGSSGAGSARCLDSARDSVTIIPVKPVKVDGEGQGKKSFFRGTAKIGGSWRKLPKLSYRKMWGKQTSGFPGTSANYFTQTSNYPLISYPKVRVLKVSRPVVENLILQVDRLSRIKILSIRRKTCLNVIHIRCTGG